MTSEPSFNPYQPPAEEERPLVAPEAQGAGFYRDGEFLMVRDGAMLPKVCLVSGVPWAPGWDPSQWLKLKWTPRWIWWGSEIIPILLLFTPLGYALVTHGSTPLLGPLWILPVWFLIGWWARRNSKNLAVLCLLSPAAVREDRRRAWIQGAINVPFLVFFNFLYDRRGHAGEGGLWDYHLGFYAWMGASQLIPLLAQAWAMRPVAVGHRDGWFCVRNCHPAFLNLLAVEMSPPATVRRPAPPVIRRPPPSRRGPF